MKIDEIRELLERYYNGDTSIEEETMLKDFFLNAEVPEDMMADKLMFQRMCSMYSSLDSVIEDSDSLKRLEQNIDVWDKNEKDKSYKIYPLFRYLGGVAAAVIILVSIGYNFLGKTENTIPDTFDNPQEAYIETQKALQLFADAFNKGNAGLQKVKSTTDKVERKLDKVSVFRK